MKDFLPEPLDALRARYLKAIDHIIDYSHGEKPWDSAGVPRENIFDCEDGLRLIISIDRETMNRCYLHISASIDENSHLYKAGRTRTSARYIFKLMRRRYVEISDDKEPLTFHGLSPGKGVPHWRRKINCRALTPQ